MTDCNSSIRVDKPVRLTPAEPEVAVPLAVWEQCAYKCVSVYNQIYPKIHSSTCMRVHTTGMHNLFCNSMKSIYLGPLIHSMILMGLASHCGDENQANLMKSKNPKNVTPMAYEICDVSDNWPTSKQNNVHKYILQSADLYESQDKLNRIRIQSN